MYSTCIHIFINIYIVFREDIQYIKLIYNVILCKFINGILIRNTLSKFHINKLRISYALVLIKITVVNIIYIKQTIYVYID